MEISPVFGTCSVAYQLGAGHAVLNCCVFVGSDSVFLITSENCDFELCCILVCLTCFDVLADWAEVRHQAIVVPSQPGLPCCGSVVKNILREVLLVCLLGILTLMRWHC